MPMHRAWLELPKNFAVPARRSVALAITGLLTFTLAACTTAPVGSNHPPKGGGGKVVDLGRDLGQYVKQPGDRVVIVPNGNYRASSVNAPHPATKGPYKGWLVLKAQSPRGVVVDLSSGMFTLGESTSRVLFVGFKFVNGSIDVQGDRIAFWYTDHSFPANEWVRQAPNKSRPEQGTYRAPRPRVRRRGWRGERRVLRHGRARHVVGPAHLEDASTCTSRARTSGTSPTWASTRRT